MKQRHSTPVDDVYRYRVGYTEVFCVKIIICVCACVCVCVPEYVSTYGHTYSKRIDQPGKVANPARGQLNRKNLV